jgi:hypothetical protein
MHAKSVERQAPHHVRMAEFERLGNLTKRFIIYTNTDGRNYNSTILSGLSGVRFVGDEEGKPLTSTCGFSGNVRVGVLIGSGPT